MTEEMKTKLHNKARDEIDDMAWYETMAGECEACGDYKAAKILNNIAHDEMTHHEWVNKVIHA